MSLSQEAHRYAGSPVCRQNGEVADRSKEALESKVHDGSEYRAFGGFTADEADARAAALREVAGFGPTMRVRPIAQAWGELARLMRERAVDTVADLPAEQVVDFAQRLWVISSGQSMLREPKPEPPDPGKV